MDSTILCRLCGMVSETNSPASEAIVHKIHTLFHLEIGGPQDCFTRCVCSACTQTISSTWEFFEQIERVQQELLKESLKKNLQDTLPNQADKHVESCSTADRIGAQHIVEHLKLEYGQEKDTDVNLSNENTTTTNKSDDIDGRLALIRTRKKKQHDNDDAFAQKDPDNTNCSILETVKRRRSNLDYSNDSDESDGNEKPLVISDIRGWDTYPWSCSECSISVTTYDQLQEHCSNEHDKILKIRCADCPKVYTKYLVFLKHVRAMHHSHLARSCDICYKWFPSDTAQFSHRAGHNVDSIHKCITCGKTFSKQSKLLLHRKSHQPVEMRKCHTCLQCSKKFGTKGALVIHERIHRGERNFTCEQCGKTFSQKCNLQQHMFSHESPQFPCDLCEKSFKTTRLLIRHGKTHSDQKPYQCDVCGNQYRLKQTLVLHRRVHTGELPYKCRFCEKSFRYNGVYKVHLRQHTGERPYSCYVCQNNFADWANCNKHMKRRHGIDMKGKVPKKVQGNIVLPPELLQPTNSTQSNSRAVMQ